MLTVDVPLSFEVEPVRQAARVLVCDEKGRALLVRFSDDFGCNWWAAPGGGLLPGENHLQLRVASSTRNSERDDIQIGAEIGWRRHTLSFNAQPWITQHERWFMASHTSFSVGADHVTSLAPEGVTEIKWWSPGDLAGSGLVTAPSGLAALIAQVTSGHPPPPGTNLGV